MACLVCSSVSDVVGEVEDLWITDDCIFEILGGPDQPVVKKGDPDTADINGGFEGGRVFVI